MTPKSAWEDNDRLIENLHRTTFEDTAELEIDERLAQEDPDHEDSLEFRRLQHGRERISETSEAMLRLLEIMMPGKPISRATVQSAGNQVLVLLWLLQSGKGDIGRMSMAAIAEKIGCTRALLSFYAKRFEKVLGFHGRGMKGKEASESYIESARRGWETRRMREAGEPDPVFVGVEEIDRTADNSPRRFELEDEEERLVESDGFSFDQERREYDLEESDI
jgi:hypothetical protein